MSAYRNQRLFSDHYLDEILPKSRQWQDVDEKQLRETLKELQSLYEKQKTSISSLTEPQLEERFIRPILRLLGHVYEVQPPIPKMREGVKHPDYAFYPSEKAKGAGINRAVAIGEAKRYGRPLDKKIKGIDPSEAQNPSLQMSRYLWLSETPWGILTDGRFWRLYERETSKRLDIYYQVDIEELLKDVGEGLVLAQRESFKYFYLFFRREAFPDFLQTVYSESLDYAEQVGKELKENVYQALKILVEGFLNLGKNYLSQGNVREIHDSALVFLYRLLFVLYAEYRRLLPVDENSLYTDTYSLDSLKKEIASKDEKNTALPHTTTHYWAKLRDLFTTINNGNKELGVPPYNGGLFDPKKHHFLEEYMVGDFYVAKVVDLLSRSKDKAFIDYSSLQIRHLGSIYEGLLEYKVDVAKEDLVPIKNKGKEVYVPSKDMAHDFNGAHKTTSDKAEVIRKGEVYLVTDRGERKATGSYYTPDNIVKYIVGNTLGPVIEEKKRHCIKVSREKRKQIIGLKKEIATMKGQISKATRRVVVQVSKKKLVQKQTQLEGLITEADVNSLLIDEILETRVLDPAIGSGHFLVEATDFLAHALVEALSGEMTTEPSEEEPDAIRERRPAYGEERSEDDIRWARREVVERCIYGVDLNPLAVELAKLSLWLSTVAKGKPLSFLDHHLRVGNSLIGAKVEDFASLPKRKRRKTAAESEELKLFDETAFTQDVKLILGDIELIEEMDSDTVDKVREKDRILRELLEPRRQKYERIAHLWTSSYFGNELDVAAHKALNDYIMGKETVLRDTHALPLLEKAEKIAKDKYFFHWELEFPEVFFDEFGRHKGDGAGFDAVVGNPPYVDAKEATGGLLRDRKVLVASNWYDWLYKKWDLYIAFVERTLKLARRDGYASLIVSETLNKEEYASRLRKGTVQDITILGLDFFPNVELFPGVGIHNTIFLFRKVPPSKNNKSRRRLHLDGSLKNFRELESLNQTLYGEKIYNFEFDPGEEISLHGNLYLDQVFYMSVGMVLNAHEDIAPGAFVKEDLITETKDAIHTRKYADNQDIFPFELRRTRFLEYNTERVPGMVRRPTFPELYTGVKLVIPRVRGGTVDYSDLICDQRIIIFKPWSSVANVSNKSTKAELQTLRSKYKLGKDDLVRLSGRFNVLFFLAIVNSPTIRKIMRRQIKRGKFDFTPDDFRVLPIPDIQFSTTQEKRQRLAQEARKLYEIFVETAEREPLMFFVRNRLQAKPEQSDIVHDLLAFTAEKMIEYNKDKNKERKSFLKWLEREIGAQIDDLSGKTAVKAYYQNSVEKLVEVLKKNKNKLKIAPSQREFQTRFEAELNKSVQRLNPLKCKIELTDSLIDNIVCRLYGLTEEEMKIVKGSV